MADKESPTKAESDVHHVITGKHPEQSDRIFFVAPSDEEKKTRNTIRLVDLPAACWRMDDICFDFNSVFLLHSASSAFDGLAKIVEKETEWGKPPKIALFGHADPVDDDKYNKQLSEDRAKVVHAVLIRNTDDWKEVFERRKQVRELQAGLNAYNSDYGLSPPSGKFDAQTHSAVKKYMQAICPAIDAKKLVFMADGNAAYQGCSEFNPVIVFSKDQLKKLNRTENRGERNFENRPNRRVIAFLWRNDARVVNKLWPCKKATAGLQPCKNQFWGQKDDRRKPRKYARQWDRKAKPNISSPIPPNPSVWTYQPAKDTFACRFYQELASFSPCEFAPPPRQRWRFLINIAENDSIAEYKGRYGMGCEFHFQFLVDLTIEMDKKNGRWVFKEASIADVTTWIQPDFNKKYMILLEKHYVSKNRILSLKGRKMTGEVELIGGEFIEGEMDANLKQYVKRSNAIYAQLNWPYVKPPFARIRSKINTTQKKWIGKEWDAERKKWIIVRDDHVTEPVLNYLYADYALSNDLNIGHKVPLTKGTLTFSRGLDIEGIRVHAMQIRYHIKRIN